MRSLALALCLLAAPAHGACTATLDSYLLFGDSRCLTGYPSDFVSVYLQAECPGVTIQTSCRNGRGVFVPGAGTTDSPLVQLQGRLAVLDPDVVLLMLGLNDWSLSGITPEAVVDGLKEMGDYAISQGVAPVVVTGFPGGDNYQNGRSDWAAEVRFRQMALGAAMNWPVIDSWEAFDQRTWSSCTVVNGVPDHVHPYSAACRAAWADYIAPRLP